MNGSQTIAAALFLALTNKTVVDYLSRPIKERFPDLDTWWLLYVSLATGAALGWLSQINLFGAFFPDELIGRVLTAVLIGGGSNLIYKVFGGDGN